MSIRIYFPAESDTLIDFAKARCNPNIPGHRHRCRDAMHCVSTRPAAENISIYFRSESDTLIDFAKERCNAVKKEKRITKMTGRIFL